MLAFAACTGGDRETVPEEPAVAEIATETAPQPADTLAVRERVDRFFEQYVALFDRGDSTAQWIDESPVLTPDFKQAYTKMLADAEAAEMGLDQDPVLNAQDVPTRPYTTRTAIITGDRATAEVTNAEWSDALIRVSLVAVNGDWMIDGINEINEIRISRSVARRKRARSPACRATTAEHGRPEFPAIPSMTHGPGPRCLCVRLGDASGALPSLHSFA